MAIPLATTTITITGVRPTSTVDPLTAGYPDDPGQPVPQTIVTGHRANISMPSTRRTSRPSGNEGAEMDLRSLHCDPVDLRDNDIVLDEQSGVSYRVVWSTYDDITDFGLDSVRAEIRKVTGGVPV